MRPVPHTFPPTIPTTPALRIRRRATAETANEKSLAHSMSWNRTPAHTEYDYEPSSSAVKSVAAQRKTSTASLTAASHCFRSLLSLRRLCRLSSSSLSTSLAASLCACVRGIAAPPSNHHRTRLTTCVRCVVYERLHTLYLYLSLSLARQTHCTRSLTRRCSQFLCRRGSCALLLIVLVDRLSSCHHTSRRRS